MIIVKLMGGLGNQMFQYATGRRLAHVRKTELMLDLSWFDNIPSTDTGRIYELSAFRICEHFASAKDLAQFNEGFLFRNAAKVLPFLKPRHIYEKSKRFDASILYLPDNVYLEGYWHSAHYFSDVSDIIKQEFTVKPEPSTANREMMDRISRSESVSIHIRRGDYITNPNVSGFHGVCSMDYYQNAIKLISYRISSPRFFIFSDDTGWAREHLAINPRTVIDLNGPDKGYEDMRLMSRCKHHIIANSSFSWWGAWLSKNPEKIVIAPKNWFRDENINTLDFVPDTWERI
jgi:hypothetical protein